MFSQRAEPASVGAFLSPQLSFHLWGHGNVKTSFGQQGPSHCPGSDTEPGPGLPTSPLRPQPIVPLLVGGHPKESCLFFFKEQMLCLYRKLKVLAFLPLT